MKLLLIAFMLTSGIAHASCTTYGNTTNCTDGSNYQRYGNSMNGYNANTGSTWNQTTYGNTTTYNDSRGNHKTCTRVGNSVSCY
jgi:hypothetical protein